MYSKVQTIEGGQKRCLHYWDQIKKAIDVRPDGLGSRGIAVQQAGDRKLEFRQLLTKNKGQGLRKKTKKIVKPKLTFFLNIEKYWHIFKLYSFKKSIIYLLCICDFKKSHALLFSHDFKGSIQNFVTKLMF